MFKYLVLCVFLILSVVSSTPSPSPTLTPSSTPTKEFNLYSISTYNDNNEKQFIMINPWDYQVINNFTISNLTYDVVDILSLDTTTNSLLLLCSDSNSEFILTVDTGSSDFQILRQIENAFNFNYALQSYVYIEDQKTATIPAQVGFNGTYYNILASSDFATESYSFLNLSSTYQAPYMIGGYDFINNIQYVAYMNYNGSFHLLTFDYNNPESYSKTYYNIQDVMMINLIFVDPSSNVYFLNQNYQNISGKIQPNGYYDLCKFNMVEESGECESIIQVYIGDQEGYSFLPWIINESKTSIALISNQSPGFNNTANFEITFVTLDTNVKEISTVSIPNDDEGNFIFSNRIFKF